MAKSKYAPALFEVIGKKDEQAPALPLPKWWRRKDVAASPAPSNASPTEDAAAAPGADGEQPVTPDSSTRGAGPAATQPARRYSAGPTTASHPDEDEERPPVARIQNGRVELSLNPVNTVIVSGVLLLTLFLTYQMGRGFRPAATATAETNVTDNTLEAARQQAGQPEVLRVGPSAATPDRNGGRTAPPNPGGTRSATPNQNRPQVPAAPAGPAAAPAVANAVQRTHGLTHVVLETFRPEHKAQAEQLRDWLLTKQLVTTIEPASGDRWQLVSTAGFDYSKESDKHAIAEFVQMTKRFGQEYKEEYKSRALYDMRSPGYVKY